MRRRTTIAAVLIVTGLSACGDGKGSTTIEKQNTGPADVMEYPHGFRNVAAKCDGPNRVYSASRGTSADSNVAGAVAVAPNDPRCRGSETP